MTMNRIAGAGWILVGIFCGTGASAVDQWPQFRGPNASGVAAGAHPPLNLSPGNWVAWQVAVPWSPSSPVVWGDRLYLTTYTEHQLETRCLDRRDGKTLWTGLVPVDQLEVFHNTDGSPAASTPATDGKHIVSYFGSFGLVCHDPQGRELWRHPLPLAISGGSYGSGTSPVIHEGLVLLNRDQDQNSSLLAVDVKTGKTAWETSRPDASGSFGTPIVWPRGKGWEVVTAQAIAALVERDAPLVAILWGRDAQNLTPMLGSTPIVASVHPSPLSARGGFFGSRPFSRVNALLAEQGADPIDWALA